MYTEVYVYAVRMNGNGARHSQAVQTYQGKDNGSGRAQTFPPGKKTLGGYTEKMYVAALARFSSAGRWASLSPAVFRRALFPFFLPPFPPFFL